MCVCVFFVVVCCFFVFCMCLFFVFFGVFSSLSKVFWGLLFVVSIRNVLSQGMIAQPETAMLCFHGDF